MRQPPRKAVASPAIRVARLIAGAGLVLLLQACGTPAPAPPPPAPAAPAPAAPPEAAPPALIGRMTADAHEYPWSALGRVNLAGLGFCTGVVIGPQQVLTQARCLYDARDGRWFKPNELHFIAAYQKDSYLADSKIADFTVAPGFNPQSGVSLANLTNNWAVVSLSEPIGRKTGWLGIELNSRRLAENANFGGTVAFLRAGYRADWPHAVSVHFGCSGEKDNPASPCTATPRETALPAFVLFGGEMWVRGDHYLHSASQASALAQASATPVSNDRLGRAQPPSGGGLVGRQPEATVVQLLEALGYPVTSGDIASAAAAFCRDHDVPCRGKADLVLLTGLLNAAQQVGP